LIEAFKLMIYTRTTDQKAVSFQRQGRMYTYPLNFGQEAAQVGSAFAMDKEIDWLVPAFRELGTWLYKGATLQDIFKYYCGYEEASTFPKAKNYLPSAVPVASQITHAAGVGYALKYQKLPGAVFAYVGDGGTSEGDFHEGMNFMGVWKAPVVVICQNNQYAISVPRSRQTASKNLAIKALAYGMNGIQVDGNDFLAVYQAAASARQLAIEGRGPSFIEAVTYRRGAHTTSDDPSRYRTSEEEERWAQKDPIKRLRNYLLAKGLWNTADEALLIETYEQEIDAAFAEIEHLPYPLENVFKYHYQEMPEHLLRQKVEYEKYLNWKEKELQK
jgi:pyruvate dehydrogenase E1 component alpha subunit